MKRIEIYNGGIIAEGNFSEQDKEKIKSLLKQYDWYTFAIDDFKTFQEAEENNEYIKDELKKMNIVKIIHKNYQLPLSEPFDKIIEL